MMFVNIMEIFHIFIIEDHIHTVGYEFGSEYEMIMSSDSTLLSLLCDFVVGVSLISAGCEVEINGERTLRTIPSQDTHYLYQFVFSTHTSLNIRFSLPVDHPVSDFSTPIDKTLLVGSERHVFYSAAIPSGLLSLVYFLPWMRVQPNQVQIYVPPF